MAIYDNTGENNAYLEYMRQQYERGNMNLTAQPVQQEALSGIQQPFSTSLAFNNMQKVKNSRRLANPYVAKLAMEKPAWMSAEDYSNSNIMRNNIFKQQKAGYEGTPNALVTNTPTVPKTIGVKFDPANAAAKYQPGGSADPLATKKGLGVTDYANIASGVLGIAQAASSIYGAKLADKMQPSLMSYHVPIEPELIESNTEALKSAAKESIASQTATARASDRSGGIVDGGRNSVYLAKGMEAENQVAGQIAQMDIQLEAQNTQAKNQAKQFNAQMGMQSDQFNAQTKNQFDQWKSSVVGAGYSNALNGLSGATGAIMNNMNLQDTIARADAKNAEALERYTQETTREESRFKIQTLLEQLRMPGLSLQQKADIQNEIKTLQV